MSDSYLNDINEARKTLKGAASSLESLAVLFYEIGNNTVSDKLFLIADDINFASKKIKSAVSERINAQYIATCSSVGNMLSSALAASEKEKE